MKIKLLFKGLYVIVASAMCCFAEAVDLPHQFTITERLLTIRTEFDIESSGYQLGYVSRTLFSLLPEYTLYDCHNQLQAVARMRWTVFGTSFDIVDSQGLLIGIVDKHALSLLFSTFDIICPNGNGQRLATAQSNFAGTEYVVTEPLTSEVIATISRPLFHFRDCWTVDVLNEELLAQKGIDPSVFVLIAVFQTDGREDCNESLSQ